MTTADERKRKREALEEEARRGARAALEKICGQFFDYIADKGMVSADQRHALVEAFMKDRRPDLVSKQ